MLISLDIETEAIVEGAPCLPKPVGIALTWEDGRSKYLAFGHPTENNCTWEDAQYVLDEIWDWEWVTHNGCSFDVEVLTHWFNMPKRDPLLTHDTMFLAYLHNPHAPSLRLKDLANDWLGIPPDAQHNLQDWIMANTDCTSRSKAGAYISMAPGGMVGPYAMDDTRMAMEMYHYLQPLVLPVMQEPYDRERRLAPILAEIQRQGVRVDVEALHNAMRESQRKLDLLTAMIRERLNAPNLDLNKGEELGAALVGAGFTGFLKTAKTGRDSMSKVSLETAISERDPDLLNMLNSRSKYDKLSTGFLGPWYAFASANGGRLHPTYNQTRNPDGYGTRTGRLSCTKPNFQQVMRDDGLVDYWGEPYPVLRSFLLPEEGHYWTCGDFKSQEPRLAAHYESGALCEAYNADPQLDVYLWLREICALPQTKTGRQIAKKIFLGLLYSMGLAKLAEELGIMEQEAQQYRFQVKAGVPDVVQLDIDCKRRFQMGLPIKTLGGRLYFCEPPSNGRDWSYKALNTLIQGSAADQCKELVIYLYEHLTAMGIRILGLVHDEVSLSVPLTIDVAVVDSHLQEGAMALPVDVPFPIDVGHGANWAVSK